MSAFCVQSHDVFLRGDWVFYLKKVREKYFAETLSFVLIRGLLFSGV